VKDMKVRRREGERREGMHGRRKGGARWRRRRTVQPSCDSPRSPARTDPPNHPNPIRPRPPPNPQRAPLPVRFPHPLPLLRLCERGTQEAGYSWRLRQFRDPVGGSRQGCEGRVVRL
jgi:hypothetical protein